MISVYWSQAISERTVRQRGFFVLRRGRLQKITTLPPPPKKKWFDYKRETKWSLNVRVSLRTILLSNVMIILVRSVGPVTSHHNRPHGEEFSDPRSGDWPVTGDWLPEARIWFYRVLTDWLCLSVAKSCRGFQSFTIFIGNSYWKLTSHGSKKSAQVCPVSLNRVSVFLRTTYNGMCRSLIVKIRYGLLEASGIGNPIGSETGWSRKENATAAWLKPINRWNPVRRSSGTLFP